MDLLPREEFETLIAQAGSPCVSVFMPVHRPGAEAPENPIRFKNLLREAEMQLAARGVPAEAAAALLDAAHALPADPQFWQNEHSGLALFSTAGLFRHYQLPFPVDERVVVGTRFHLTPLLPLVASGGRFFVLALSQNAVRLLEGTQETITEVPLPVEVPASLAAALRYDDFEQQAQFYTSASGRHDAPGAVFYGQQVGSDMRKDELVRYAHQIDRGLAPLLRGLRVPLVLAGVDYLQAIYRSVNTYSHLLPVGIAGNPDETPAQGLHNQAWPLLQAVFGAAEHDTAAQYRQWAGTGLTSTAIEEIVPAALGGRVARLLVPADGRQWGHYDAASGTVVLEPTAESGADDLLDLAAVATWQAGGQVYVVPRAEVPADAPIAALFRY